MVLKRKSAPIKFPFKHTIFQFMLITIMPLKCQFLLNQV